MSLFGFPSIKFSNVFSDWAELCLSIPMGDGEGDGFPVADIPEFEFPKNQMNAAATEFNLDFCRQATQDLWQEISIRETISLQDFINWERNGSSIPENSPLVLDLDSDSRENTCEIEESECSSVCIRGEQLVAEKDVETVHEESQEVFATREPIQYTTTQHSNEKPSLALDTVQSKLIRKLFPPNQQLKPQTTNQDNNLIEKITALELENNNLKNSLNKCRSERDDLSRKLTRLKQEEVGFFN